MSQKKSHWQKKCEQEICVTRKSRECIGKKKKKKLNYYCGVIVNKKCYGIKLVFIVSLALIQFHITLIQPATAYIKK